MAGDANYASVVFLLPADGTNGSTAFDDKSASPRAITVYGDAQISTTQSKYGGASAKFDGTGDYLSVAYNSLLSLVGVDFTIEAWVYLNALSSDASTVVDKDGVSGASYPQYQLAVSPAGELTAFLGNGNGVSPTGTSYVGTTTVTTSAWHHVALVKTGSTCKGFLDGAQEWSSAAATMYEGSKALLVGYQAGQPSGAYINGYIDDLRITKGVARYTAAFTPPARAHPLGLGEVSGVIRDNAGSLCARTVRAYRRDTGALLSSTVSDASTGAYLLAMPTLDEVNIVAYDDVSGSTENDRIIRVVPA